MLPIRDGYFQLTLLVSVVSLEEAGDLGLDIGKVIKAEDPDRQKKINPNVMSKVKANSEKI